MQKQYDFICDPGHGWIEVPRAEVNQLGIAAEISPYSYQKGAFCYLEEDSDAGKFIDAANAAGWHITFNEVYQENTPIRRYQRYTV